MKNISVTKAGQVMDVAIAAKNIALEAQLCTEATPAERCKEIYNLYVKFRNLSDCTDDLDSEQIEAWKALMSACRCYLVVWYIQHSLHPVNDADVIEMLIDFILLAREDEVLRVFLKGGET